MISKEQTMIGCRLEAHRNRTLFHMVNGMVESVASMAAMHEIAFNPTRPIVKLIIKKVGDEFQVVWSESKDGSVTGGRGHRVESKTYYTDDKEDARRTRNAMMVREFHKYRFVI